MTFSNREEERSEKQYWSSCYTREALEVEIRVLTALSQPVCKNTAASKSTATVVILVR